MTAMRKSKFKKGDRVMVVAGPNKGAVGAVLKVSPRCFAVVVQGVNMRKRCRRSKVGMDGSDVAVERAVHESNVMHLDPMVSVPVRIGFKIVDGKKVRYSKKSGELLCE